MLKMIQGECWWTSHITTKLQGQRPSLALMTKYQNDATFKEIGLPKTWSIHHHQENQWSGLSIELLNFMKFHHVFHVFLMKPCHASTIPRKVPKPLSPIEINGK
jgi:hypothetical protein